MEKNKSTHKDLNKKFDKLNIKQKEVALEAAYRYIQMCENVATKLAKQKEAEKGKRVGYECTCVEEVKGSCNVDLYCRYCRFQHDRDYLNSPG